MVNPLSVLQRIVFVVCPPIPNCSTVNLKCTSKEDVTCKVCDYHVSTAAAAYKLSTDSKTCNSKQYFLSVHVSTPVTKYLHLLLQLVVLGEVTGVGQESVLERRILLTSAPV